MISLLWQIRSVKKAFAKANRLRQVAPMFNFEQAEEIVRNAAAYGWEIGNNFPNAKPGMPLPFEVELTDANPFGGEPPADF
jgi:hypothetical protein